MDQSHSSRRLLLVGLAAVVGLILVIALVAYLLVGTSKKQNAASPSPAAHVASKAEMNQSLSDLNATLKQASADQAAAKTAITEGANQAQAAN